MVEYRPDPKNPRQLTEEEARRLDETPIDYSEIPPLDQIAWSQCADVESVPDRCSGAWVAKDSRVMVEGILENGEDCSAEEVADMFELPVDQVRKVLLFAYETELKSLAKAHRESPNLPHAYEYRAGVLVRKVAELARALRPQPAADFGAPGQKPSKYDHPDMIWLEPCCAQCDRPVGWQDEDYEMDCEQCGTKSVPYIRADLCNAKIDEMISMR